jgi:transposase-like protein
VIGLDSFGILVERGLSGVQLVVSVAHAGLKKAIALEACASK